MAVEEAARDWRGYDSALEAEHDARLGAMYAALRHLLETPAPDLAAFAAKIELMIDHEVATLSGGEACLEAIRRDALRLRSGQTLETRRKSFPTAPAS